MEAPNTAGDALNDLLGVEDSNDFEEEFKTLEPNDADEVDSGRKDTPTDGTTAPLHPNPYASAESRTVEADESVLGDVEDNESDPEESEVEQKTLSRGGGRPRGRSNGSTLKNSKMTKPKYSLRRKMEKPAVALSDSGTPRRSRRVNKMQLSSNSRKMRSQANTKAQQIASSNRSKMTARAMVLRKKAKAKKIASPAEKEDYFTAVYGRKRKAEKQATPQPAKKKKATKKQGADDAAKQEYFRAVYGRKSKAKGDDILEQYEWEPGYVDVVPSAVARAMETVKGWMEVDVEDDGVDMDEYVRMW